jgi:hypothetical protein
MDPAGFDGRRNLVADVDVARQTLLDARSRLDLALAALPEIDGDEAMATPALLLLLVGAVKAKERLGRLEDLLRDLVEER